MAEDMNLSMEEATDLYYGNKEFEQAKLTYMYTRGQHLVASEKKYNDLPTYMCQMHGCYMLDTSNGVYTGFKVITYRGLIFNQLKEMMHYLSYEHLY